MIHPVIMAGGTGSRLWPLSRQLNPKQFLKLTDEHLSMLQLTVARLEGMESADPLLICNEEHRFLAAEQMRQAGYKDARIILEPCGRNTAPAIALAALQLAKTAGANDDDPLMLVLAADHLIQDVAAFQNGIRKATPLAQQGKLVTFGIVPAHAETGYGYIQQGPELAEDSYGVDRFVEKPDQKTAEQYLASGDYLWNSGMFMFGARRYLAELQKHRPDILAICQAAVDDASEDLHFTRINESIFPSARKTPSTTRLWKKPATPPLWLWMLDGATLAPGLPCGKCPKKMKTATASAVMLSPTTPKAHLCGPKADWSQPSAFKTW